MAIQPKLKEYKMTPGLLNTKTLEFAEYEFTAKNLDSLDTITDVTGINVKVTEDRIPEVIKNTFKNHPIISLDGNWEVEGWVKTGRVTKAVSEQFLVSERDEEYKNVVYPLMNDEDHE